MMFARYKGARPGLTEGKVYVARPQMEDSGMVGLGRLELEDDSEKTIQVMPEEGQFEFLSEVYAVVAEPFDGFVAGDVVVLDDATQKSRLGDALLYNVKGLGYRDSETMCVLDRTNVFPGVVVMDLSTGVWVKVRMVDEALWVTPEGSESMRSPEEFRFAVSDGDIMVEPIVKCLDASGEPDLTVGRYYQLQQTLEASGCIVVANDRGICGTYLADRFELAG